MTDLVTEVSRLVTIAESGKPSLRRSTLWKNKVLDVLREAQRAQLAIRYQDTQDSGACEGSWEDEICDQETQFGSDLNETRIERLKRQLHATSESSMAKTKSASVTVLKR